MCGTVVMQHTCNEFSGCPFKLLSITYPCRVYFFTHFNLHFQFLFKNYFDFVTKNILGFIFFRIFIFREETSHQLQLEDRVLYSSLLIIQVSKPSKNDLYKCYVYKL